MLALVILMAVVLGVVVVLLVGLLRTHAEVLRRLHELGAGIYDEAPAPSAAHAADLPMCWDPEGCCAKPKP